jgi:hypothetical protein
VYLDSSTDYAAGQIIVLKCHCLLLYIPGFLASLLDCFGMIRPIIYPIGAMGFFDRRRIRFKDARKWPIAGSRERAQRLTNIFCPFVRVP